MSGISSLYFVQLLALHGLVNCFWLKQKYQIIKFTISVIRLSFFQDSIWFYVFIGLRNTRIEMRVGFYRRKLQLLCLEGRFLNISMVGTTDLFRVVTWIKSSNFIVWSCKTAHRSHSEVSFFEKKPNPKIPFLIWVNLKMKKLLLSSRPKVSLERLHLNTNFFD